MSTATATVTKVIAGFTALFEGDVAWDACGCVANEVALAALSGRKPDVGLALKVRARDIAAGRMNRSSIGQHGQYLSDIYWDLGQRGVQKMDFINYSPTPNLDAIHAQIKSAAMAGLPSIIVITRAYNLPDNEAGVAGHFVVIGGIDSTKGYLIANGDTKTAIATRATNPPLNWATWQTLVNAGIAGVITLHPNPTTPPPPPPPAPAPPTPAPDLQAEIDALKASVATARSEAAQAVSVAQDAQSLAQHLQTALRGV